MREKSIGDEEELQDAGDAVDKLRYRCNFYLSRPGHAQPWLSQKCKRPLLQGVGYLKSNSA